MNYLVKNKKYTFMIIFFILVFIPINVKALVPKGTLSNTVVQTTYNGTIYDGNQQWLRFEFNDPILPNNKDALLMRFTRFNLTTATGFSIDNPFAVNPSSYTFRCTSPYSNSQFCNQASITPTGSVTSDLYGTIITGDIRYFAYAYDSDFAKSTICYFTSEYEDALICPFNDLTNFKYIEFFINQNGYDYVNYNIIFQQKEMYVNYDTTELVNALNGVSTNVNATTSAIEQQTQQQAQQNAYVQNSNITQAQTNTTTSITTLNDQLTAELSQFSDLTQLVLSPITIFMELNNNVCAPLTLQIPFVNQTAVIPCMKPVMQQHFGTMYSVFTTVIGAILCYWTFVRTVALIKDLIDADNDKIEVVDL